MAIPTTIVFDPHSNSVTGRGRGARALALERVAIADLEGRRSIEIAAPAERCFAIAADLDHVPEWHGAMTDVEVLERNADGLASVVDSTINVTVTSVRIRLRFSYDKPNGLGWTRESGDLRSLDGWWRFEERGGLTVATYGLEIGLSRRLSVLVKTVRGPLRDGLEALLTDRPVEGLKARAESRGEAGLAQSGAGLAQSGGIHRPPSRMPSPPVWRSASGRSFAP